MTSVPVGTLTANDGRYEFSYPELNLKIQGAHAEWVLEAAAEVIRQTEKLRNDGAAEEMEMLLEFGEGSETELESLKYDINARFEAVPQCIVTMGAIDYRWVSPDGRKGEKTKYVERIHDMSLTRNDTFLRDR